MTTPNFFTSNDSVEKVFLTEDQAYWINFKTDLTMEDMASIKDMPKQEMNEDGEVNPYSGVLVTLRACIVEWNLPDPENDGKIMPITMDTIRKLNVGVFAKLAPYVTKVQQGSFLVERSAEGSAPQSSSEEQIPTTSII